METIARIDKKSRGKQQRYTIGTVDSPISGALYVKQSVELPAELTIKFPKKKKEV